MVCSHIGRGGVALLLALVLANGPAVAQDDADAQQRAEAAEAYDRGTSAFLEREWAQAAYFFEQAHRLAPAAPALVRAVQSHQRAGNDLRAANLALRLETLYPDDRAARRLYRPILRDARRDYGVIEVSCDAECTAELDGTLLEHPAFFVEAGQAHEVGASFDTGAADRQTVTVASGETRALSFVAPPPPPPEPEVEPPVTTPAPQPLLATTPNAAEDDGGSGGLPPAVFIASAALTLGSVGALVWSGVDTLNDAKAYESAVETGDLARARQLLAAGEDEERRTNILAGVTAVVGAATVIIAIVTDWDGASAEGDDSEGQGVTASVGLSPDGGSILLQGRF